MQELNVKDLMSTDLVVLRPDEHIDLADDVMKVWRFRHLPVVDGKRLLGVVSIRDFVGEEITTIEGLAGDDGELHPMQAAFMECHGLQCGYCTPGMVMAATSLVAENGPLDEAAVREGLEGNLCRCTGYHNIVKAVLSVGGAS